MIEIKIIEISNFRSYLKYDFSKMRLCIFKYIEDGFFYRVLVMLIDLLFNFLVYFVDFGNK